MPEFTKTLPVTVKVNSCSGYLHCSIGCIFFENNRHRACYCKYFKKTLGLVRRHIWARCNECLQTFKD